VLYGEAGSVVSSLRKGLDQVVTALLAANYGLSIRRCRVYRDYRVGTLGPTSELNLARNAQCAGRPVGAHQDKYDMSHDSVHHVVVPKVEASQESMSSL
jgi:hypothetical protein